MACIILQNSQLQPSVRWFNGRRIPTLSSSLWAPDVKFQSSRSQSGQRLDICLSGQASQLLLLMVLALVQDTTGCKRHQVHTQAAEGSHKLGLCLFTSGRHSGVMKRAWFSKAKSKGLRADWLGVGWGSVTHSLHSLSLASVRAFTYGQSSPQYNFLRKSGTVLSVHHSITEAGIVLGV